MEKIDGLIAEARRAPEYHAALTPLIDRLADALEYTRPSAVLTEWDRLVEVILEALDADGFPGDLTRADARRIAEEIIGKFMPGHDTRVRFEGAEDQYKRDLGVVESEQAIVAARIAERMDDEKPWAVVTVTHDSPPRVWI